MNNLLRTLTQSHVKPAGDLRLLLTTVKEGRRQSYDSKLTDPFYDSLEGLLMDLKTITIDNRDAEAFLKPIFTARVLHLTVIQNPMDFQTMLKRVQDDLDLIWSNCLTYNAAENHPLRPCVKRLQVKAERLLKHITDRKERTDPPIPSDLPSTGAVSAKSRRDIPFSDTPAIVRTPEGMAMFTDLDREVGAVFPKSALAHTLRELAPPMEYGSEGEEDTAVGGASLGEKRKSGASDRRPRKKARFIAQYPTPLEESDDVSQLWWGAVQSDALLGNGLPGIPFGPSSSKQKKVRTTPKPKRAKRTEQPPPPNPKSLLTMMNTNIKTMRRLRHTHAKFAALNAATAPPEDEEQGAESGLFTATGPGTAQRPWKIDEEPWTAGKGKGKSKVSGIELGEENAMDCMHWSTNKILEHAGFQGTSKVALDVLADVTSQYLMNVGRTIKFLTDKFGKTMTPEEIILHTLFESGSSKVQDIERYISDDIERYGTRLGELEKKLVGAYRETTAGELLEDGGLFEEEDEEETGALAIGEFADLLGEDYLGLRELGIAAEFGMSNLTIPKRLLKGKKGQNKPTALKPTEPPPPYPPPPPFVPLTAAKVDDQIEPIRLACGLDQHSTNNMPSLSAIMAPPPVPAGAAMPPSQIPPTAPPNALPPPNPDLRDVGATKKKAKVAGPDGAAPPAPAGAAFPPVAGAAGTPEAGTAPAGGSPKKKKGNAGVGSGNGKKKKPMGRRGGAVMPPVVFASA
ncbi:hypothetical protein BJ912DRAFT_986398 [Pholiota molesta]|nr:hypothetical protein BJ912DRAFT_986398 [Pholiota molesta]